MAVDKGQTSLAHIVVGGRVQGVGFRWYVSDVARSLNLGGTVRNLMNGDVEVYAEGARGEIERLVERLKAGTGHSMVTKCDVVWSPAEGKYRDFRILLDY